MNTTTTLLDGLHKGDFRALARCISMVENDSTGYEDILHELSIDYSIPVIGITGPPGAGKSTLVNALIESWSQEGLKIGVIAIDPTSPFNFGSLLGDRIRMVEHFNKPNVFIRSLATRGSLGGLSAKTVEINDVMRAAKFDRIIVETVGVGQSEVEIIGLADTTIVVLVPEAGDEIQSIKSGLMEIADIFVVNKADRDGAATFANNLKKLLHERKSSVWQIPVIKTIASKLEGIAALRESIEQHTQAGIKNTKQDFLMTEKAYKLIQTERMKSIDKHALHEAISAARLEPNFNLYSLLKTWR